LKGHMTAGCCTRLKAEGFEDEEGAGDAPPAATDVSEMLDMLEGRKSDKTALAKAAAALAKAGDDVLPVVKGKGKVAKGKGKGKGKPVVPLLAVPPLNLAKGKGKGKVAKGKGKGKGKPDVPLLAVPPADVLPMAVPPAVVAKAKPKPKAVAGIAKAKPKAKAAAAAGAPDLQLGCSKCRWRPDGCAQCKNPTFTGFRWSVNV
jgi:hypothetical protein